MGSPDRCGDLPQHIPGGNIHNVPQQVDILRGAELFQGVKVRGVEPGVIRQSQPVEQQKSHAVFHQPLKGVLRDRNIRGLQQLPIGRNDCGGVGFGHLKDGIGQYRSCGMESLLQHLHHDAIVIQLQVPEGDRFGLWGGVGVLYVEVVLDAGLAPSAAKDGNPCGAAPWTLSKPLFPLGVGQHRHSIGPLVMN